MPSDSDDSEFEPDWVSEEEEDVKLIDEITAAVEDGEGNVMLRDYSPPPPEEAAGKGNISCV